MRKNDIKVYKKILTTKEKLYIFTELIVKGMCGNWLVWTSFIIAEVLSTLVSVIFMRNINKKKIMSIGRR